MRQATSNEQVAHGATAAPPSEPEHTDDELVMFLEPDQLVIDKARAVPRARLSRRQRAALWALRVLVVILGAMVIYTFFAQLSG